MKSKWFRHPLQRSFSATKGFTMVEMLIAMVILVIGLLAVGLLQLRGMAMTRDANMRTSAIFAARTLGDAMKANYGVNYALAPTNAWPAGSIAAAAGCNYTLYPNGNGYINPTIACACTRRNADFEQTFNSIQNLPDPSNGGRIEVIRSTNMAGGFAVAQHYLTPQSCAAAQGTSYRIRVRWSEGTAAIGMQDQFVELEVMP